MTAPRRFIRAAVPAVALLALAVAALAPVALVGAGGGPDLPGRSLLEPLGATLATAAAATILAMLLATPAGWALARRPFAGARAVRALAWLGALSPPPLVAIAATWLLPLVGPGGTLAGFVLALLAWLLPIALLLAERAFAAVPRALEEAARVDGLGPAAIARRVSLPAATPALRAVTALVFSLAWGEQLLASALLGVDQATLATALSAPPAPGPLVLAAMLPALVAGALALPAIAGLIAPARS